ncbi:MAG: prepilin peptidase [Actinobacteria bacterium]|nr:prepilin peptidase [Actinomycetota bacterium]
MRLDLDVLLYSGSFLLGLVIGSFLNVVIHRVPLRQSLVRPGSHCPHCAHSIRWYDNIPVLSWLILRGRCRDCGAQIGIRYPLVEVLTAALFTLGALAAGWELRLLLLWGFFAVLVVVTFIDIDHMLILNRVVIPAGALGLAASIALVPSRWWEYLISGCGAALFLFLIALLWPGGMGLGDVKLALLLGFVLGAKVIVAMFAAFLLGGVVGISLLAGGRRSRKDKIPFGPFLALGGIIGSLVGDHILVWYVGLIGWV